MKQMLLAVALAVAIPTVSFAQDTKSDDKTTTKTRTTAKKKDEGKKKEKSAGAVKDAGNANCPISGAPVGSMQAGSHVVYNGYKVGLCCDGCQGRFNQDPEANLKKALGR